MALAPLLSEVTRRGGRNGTVASQRGSRMTEFRVFYRVARAFKWGTRAFSKARSCRRTTRSPSASTGSALTFS